MKGYSSTTARAGSAREGAPAQAAELRPLLQRWLPEYGYRAEAATFEPMAHYLARVAAANQRLRLVGSALAETLVRRHLGESLYLGQLLDLGERPLLDLGSGAGFPGLALALGWPELNTTLVEATGKKAAFLQEAVQALGLSDRVRVRNAFLPRRPPPAEPGWGGLVTVRALEHMARVPEWLGRWLLPSAEVAFWVSAELAAHWRARYPEWRWSELAPLPASHSRGIVRARFAPTSRLSTPAPGALTG